LEEKVHFSNRNNKGRFIPWGSLLNCHRLLIITSLNSRTSMNVFRDWMLFPRRTNSAKKRNEYLNATYLPTNSNPSLTLTIFVILRRKLAWFVKCIAIGKKTEIRLSGCQSREALSTRQHFIVISIWRSINFLHTIGRRNCSSRYFVCRRASSTLSFSHRS
jgi:hypothetical protein